LIANGESCDPELLGQLLEWSPFVMVLDNAIGRVLDLGLKVDVWLGDFDGDHDVEAVRARQYPLEIIHTPDQNKIDLHKGLEWLIERGFPAVNIVWATGRRADHTLANLTDIVRYKDQIRIVMLDDHSKVTPLTGSFEKWYAAGTPLSLLPVGTVEGVETEGLAYNLHDEPLTLGYRTSSSNAAAADGFVRIRYRRGDLLLMECWD